MRSATLRGAGPARTALAALLLAGALLASCGEGDDRGAGEPELVLVQLVQRSELPSTRERTLELGGARGLAELVPPRAFPDGRLPDLPALPEGNARVAALLAGCRESADPVLEEQRGRWVARFPESADPVACVLPDYYVAVWHVPE